MRCPGSRAQVIVKSDNLASVHTIGGTVATGRPTFAECPVCLAHITTRGGWRHDSDGRWTVTITNHQ